MQALAYPAPETLASHRGYLYRYALSRLRHPDAAEELVQETLLAALEGQAKFRGESALRTWLAGILKHKIVDWQRRETRSPISVGIGAGDLDSENDERGSAPLAVSEPRASGRSRSCPDRRTR